MSIRLVLVISCIAVAGSLAGAKEPISEPEFRQKFGLLEEEYFDDPLVIELCHAIAENDLAAMDR